MLAEMYNDANRKGDDGVSTRKQTSSGTIIVDHNHPYISNLPEAWVVNEAFRIQGEELDYYKMRKKVLGVQESLLRRYKQEADENQRRIHEQLAARVQPMPDDAGSVISELTTPTVIHHHPVVRRPGPDTDESEFSNSSDVLARPAAPTTNPHRRQPAKPVRGACQCCFEEIMAAHSSSCEGNPSHTFCNDCLRRYVTEWTFGGADYELKEGYTLPCMAANCSEGYIPHTAVEGVCSEGLWENYQEKVFRTEALASMPLRSTNVTRYKSFTSHHGRVEQEEESIYALSRRRSFDDEDVLQGVIRSESVPDIVRTSHHKPPSPAPVTKVAEAMTQAKVRKCPNCAISFLKVSGCNKMKCPMCKTYMCYICRVPVPKNGYDHFCQHSYDTCRKCNFCPLWTKNDETVDQARVTAVANDEAHRLWEEALLNNSTGTDKVPVNPDELINAGQKKQSRRSKWKNLLKKK